jgi:uncharacterized damage-inducible protein DinB
VVRRAAADEAALAAAFIAESRRRLRGEYLPKLRRVVAPLSAAELWWRPNSRSNSIGNLLLHLDGNIRQWIVAGVGARTDRRDRDAEFAARDGASARTLLARLDRTLRTVDTVLARLGPHELLERRRIQGYDITVLQAVYHVVEHFSGHTGQILYAVKLRRGRDLDFYPHLAPGHSTGGASARLRTRPRAGGKPVTRRRRYM